jgi:hypothetical protein
MVYWPSQTEPAQPGQVNPTWPPYLSPSHLSHARTHCPLPLRLPLLAGDAPPPLCLGPSPANPIAVAFRNHFLPLSYIAAVLYLAHPRAPWTLARPRRPTLLRPVPLFDTAPAWPPPGDLLRLNTRNPPLTCAFRSWRRRDGVTAATPRRHLHMLSHCELQLLLLSLYSYGLVVMFDVYARVCSCRQYWASKCRGL